MLSTVNCGALGRRQGHTDMGALGFLLGMMSLLTTHTLESEAETITNTLGAADVKENFLFVIQPQGQMQTKGRQKGWGLQADFKAVLH